GAAGRAGAGGALEGRGGPPAGASPGLGLHASMARRVDLVVPARAAGTRLDRFLATVSEVGTRSQAKRLIDAGHVRVDGALRKSAHLLGAGARLEIEVPAPEPLAAEPEALPLTVLYEDADLLAIDKPPGMVVHPAPGARRGTVVNALVHRLGALAGVGRPDRPGIVHRLDRDTSRVLPVAGAPRSRAGRRSNASRARPWCASSPRPAAPISCASTSRRRAIRSSATGSTGRGGRGGRGRASPSHARPSTPPRSASTTPRAAPAPWSARRCRRTWSSSSRCCAKRAAARGNRAIPLDSPGPIP